MSINGNGMGINIPVGTPLERPPADARVERPSPQPARGDLAPRPASLHASGAQRSAPQQKMSLPAIAEQQPREAAEAGACDREQAAIDKALSFSLKMTGKFIENMMKPEIEKLQETMKSILDKNDEDEEEEE